MLFSCQVKMIRPLLLGCLLSVIAGRSSAAEEYYVSPTPLPNPNCPQGNHCHTLNQYAINSSQFFDNIENIFLLFLDGVHNLTHQLEVSGTTNFYMSRLPTVDNHVPVIAVDLQSDSGLSFNGILNLTIEDLMFISCNHNIQNRMLVRSDCFRLINVDLFVGQKLLFVKCGINAGYDFKQNTVTNHTQHVSKVISSIGTSTSNVIMIRFSQFDRANVSIQSSPRKGNEISSYGSILTTFAHSSFEVGGIFAELEGTGFSLDVFNMSFSNGTNAVDILVNKTLNQTVNVNIQHTTLSKHMYGVYLRTDNGNGRALFVVNVTNSLLNSNSAALFFDTGIDELILNLLGTILSHNHQTVYIVSDESGQDKVPSVTIVVRDCEMKDNAQSGLFVYGHNVVIDITGCAIENNGDSGVVIQSYSASYTNVTITNSNISHNEVSGLLIQVASAYINLKGSRIEHNTQTGVTLATDQMVSVEFENSFIKNNTGGGINIQLRTEGMVYLLNTTIEQNYKLMSLNDPTGPSSVSSAGLDIFCWNGRTSKIIIINSTFQHNHDYTIQNKVVSFYDCDLVKFEGTNLFYNNTGTPVLAYQNPIEVSGQLTFQENTCYQGGALSLQYSTLCIDNHTMINFLSNSATDTGGAMYVKHIVDIGNNMCFYQLVNVSKQSIEYYEIEVNFRNNTATNGGEAIYGAALHDDCYVTAGVHSYSFHREAFFFDNKTELGLSPVSSEPSRVCLCNEQGIPQCAESSYVRSELDHAVYPGEAFSLSAVIVGKQFGTVSGSVYANLMYLDENKETLDTSQYSQAVKFYTCNQLDYNVYLKPTKAILVLTAMVANIQTYITQKYVNYVIGQYRNNNVTSDTILNLPVYINITIEECPPGFSLSNMPPFKCECDQRLKSNGIQHCTIQNHTGMVYRTGTIWLSISNVSNGITVHQYCPYGYCKDNNISINPQNPDEQCALNRAGKLCGKCQSGFSLALGSHRCILCPNNNYIALIVPIVLGTVLLVILIKVLDLTVAKGTLNGLIFYANIIWANQSILFPTSETKDTLYYINHVFIAWLNLDFGIETCFIKDLDAFGKTWFHFGQDIFYVIIIATLIILFSRYSTLATKILGNNSVPVLATMFFLSYAKLLQTIIDSLGFSLLSYSNTTEIVWSLDGNVPYFGLKHSFLFVIALAAFFLLWLPYTIVLTFGQCLRRKSHFKFLRWVDKQKPYFDAYFGPLKDRYHYWFGLLLFVRGILFITLAITSTFSPLVNLLTIAMIGAGLLVHPYQYRNWIHSLIEKLFFLNLVFVACGALYAELLGKEKRPIVYTSVGITLALFVGIVLLHIFVTIKSYCDCKEKKNNGISRITDNRQGYENVDRTSQQEHLEESYHFNNEILNENARLREPLLESSSVN